jgi:hypothetical protein
VDDRSERYQDLKAEYLRLVEALEKKREAARAVSDDPKKLEKAETAVRAAERKADEKKAEMRTVLDEGKEKP